MIRSFSFLLILTSASAPAADPLHIPVLCSHWRESHAVAGSIVGLGMNEYLKEVTPLGPVNRALIAVGTALVLGYAKEHLMDHHARNYEIPAWGVGAALAVGIRFTF